MKQWLKNSCGNRCGQSLLCIRAAAISCQQTSCHYPGQCIL